MTINRRFFLRDSSLVMAGAGLAPLWLARAAETGSGEARRKVLVALFQRGAMDGLNAVIPFSDKQYYSMRPSIAIPAPGKPDGAIDLDGRFALHPSLGPLKPLWDRKQLAIVHAVGSSDPTRSHFDAQDYMESGTPGRKSTRDGWLNRALPPPGAPATPLRAIAMGSRLPRTMRGANSAVAIGSIHGFKLEEKKSKGALEAMYAGTHDADLAAPGRDTFEAMKLIEAIDRKPYSPASGASYPNSKFGQSLQQIARLIKADVGVEVAFSEIGGWDTHTAESQRLPGLLSDLGGSLAAFCADLGDRFEDMTVVTMSEFGRTVQENGNGGTDHGHANVMLVAGGSTALKGGRVHGAWPGLEPEQLYERRDLAVTTDFRIVLGELISGHLGVKELDRVFPGAAGLAAARVGLLG